MWQLFFTPRAKKDLFCLEKLLMQRILSKIEESAKSPETSYSKLVGFSYYKLRVGDYRIIAFLDFEKRAIEIRRIGHRKNIYDKI